MIPALVVAGETYAQLTESQPWTQVGLLGLVNLRRGSGEYVGRVLSDALKFHAVRVLDLGLEGFEEISRCYLALPKTG